MGLLQDKLDELAEKAYRADSLLLGVGDYFQAEHNPPDDVQVMHDKAREYVLSIQHELVTLGAHSPIPHREEWHQDEITPSSALRRLLALVVTDADRNGWKSEHVEKARQLLGLPMSTISLQFQETLQSLNEEAKQNPA